MLRVKSWHVLFCNDQSSFPWEPEHCGALYSPGVDMNCSPKSTCGTQCSALLWELLPASTTVLLCVERRICSWSLPMAGLTAADWISCFKLCVCRIWQKLSIWSYVAEPEGLGIVMAVGDLKPVPSSSLEMAITLPGSLLDGDILVNFFLFEDCNYF